MAKKGSTEIRESRKSRWLGKLAGRLMQAFCATLRFEVIDRCGVTGQAGAPAGPVPGPVVYGLWHDSIFVMPAVWKKTGGRFRQLVVLTSASHDGATLAEAVGVFGIGSVRGSSSRRGVAALVGLRKVLREGLDVCITPDGPRGPRRELQPGLVKLAETGGVPVVPVHVEFAAAWRLKTWDRFQIPKPFSRVRVIFDETLAVPPGLADDAFEAWRARIEEVLRGGAGD